MAAPAAPQTYLLAIPAISATVPAVLGDPFVVQHPFIRDGLNSAKVVGAPFDPNAAKEAEALVTVMEELNRATRYCTFSSIYADSPSFNRTAADGACVRMCQGPGTRITRCR